MYICCLQNQVDQISNILWFHNWNTYIYLCLNIYIYIKIYMFYVLISSLKLCDNTGNKNITYMAMGNWILKLAVFVQLRVRSSRYIWNTQPYGTQILMLILGPDLYHILLRLKNWVIFFPQFYAVDFIITS